MKADALMMNNVNPCGLDLGAISVSVDVLKVKLSAGAEKAQFVIFLEGALLMGLILCCIIETVTRSQNVTFSKEKIQGFLDTLLDVMIFQRCMIASEDYVVRQEVIHIFFRKIIYQNI